MLSFSFFFENSENKKAKYTPYQYVYDAYNLDFFIKCGQVALTYPSLKLVSNTGAHSYSRISQQGM
jgi:hypothetical protein